MFAAEPNEHDFTPETAQEECERLRNAVTDALVRQVNDHVAWFTMAVEAMLSTEGDLKKLLHEAVTQIDFFSFFPDETDRVEAWLCDLRGSPLHGPKDYQLAVFYKQKKHVALVTNVRKATLRLRHMIEQLAEPPSDWVLTRITLLGREVSQKCHSYVSQFIADSAPDDEDGLNIPFIISDFLMHARSLHHTAHVDATFAQLYDFLANLHEPECPANSVLREFAEDYSTNSRIAHVKGAHDELITSLSRLATACVALQEARRDPEDADVQAAAARLKKAEAEERGARILLKVNVELNAVCLGDRNRHCLRAWGLLGSRCGALSIAIVKLVAHPRPRRVELQSKKTKRGRGVELDRSRMGSPAEV
ncbi:hypothetical protein LXA43DRAFT_1064065 [Ganoderma leucocontextum]|nr:hypothetical protein LXA43DRAFT_1064065 [Ganoderma leucocontextum]